MIRDLAIDIETYSSADLTRTGVYKYAEAEDFEILLFAYSADGGPVEVVDLAQGEELPKEIREALFEPETLKHAFNAAFERVCLSRYLGLPAGRYLDPGPWRCTQLHAAYFGLPLSLAGAGAALRLQERKLESGQALIRTFSLPRKDGKRQTAESPDMAEKWAAFKAYCAQDVVTEDAIRARLARFEVPDFIWAEYAMDQRINDRGVLVDTALARSAVAMDDAERIELSEELRILTGLENPNSAAQLKRWLAENETEVDSLAAKNVRRLLDNAEGRLKRVLELRQGLAKSSTRKYLAMVNAACADGRARGMFQFYGANRSGRWAGRIIQFQNLPREQPENPEAAREMVLAGDREALRERFSSVPSALSGLIRTALIAPPGKKLIVADYSAIEARVLAWLAGEEWQNELFRKGGDLYCMTASRMFGVPVEKNGVNGHLRQKGKVASLACGYGGAVGALKAMAEGMSFRRSDAPQAGSGASSGAPELGLSEEEMAELVRSWRAANPAITAFWWAVDQAIRTAIVRETETRLDTVPSPAGRLLRFMYRAGTLMIRLPSGRSLVYPGTRMEFSPEKDQPVITYFGTDAAKKWTRIESYGPKFVENIVQAISRDILANAMRRVGREGYRIIAHVHDEVIIEAFPEGSADEVCELMGQGPDWAEGLYLTADGFESGFYRK